MTVRSLRAEGLSKFHERDHVLFRCSFELTAGQSLVALGPNGAGKSTLLSLLATLWEPSEGEVFLDGRAVRGLDRDWVRGQVGLVAHDGMLYLELTGRENLAFFARLMGTREAEVDTWLERVHLTAAADVPVANYSRGMKQRLSIARALQHDPSVVLFDEPLTGLDRESQAFFFGILAELRAAGKLVVCVTHHLEWPAELVDWVLVLSNGLTRFSGPTDGRSLVEVYGAHLH